MKTQAIIEMMMTKVKSILQNPSEQLEQTFEKIALKRRLYQNQEGKSFVPLDHAWNAKGCQCVSFLIIFVDR